MKTIKETVLNCNGCEACVVGCKNSCIKMGTGEDGIKRLIVNTNGCQMCNNCKLFCPIFNPVELPEFESFYEYNDDFYKRNMSKVYRETMRKLKQGEAVKFAGTLCQIAALKSLMGDKLHERLELMPIHCDPEHPARKECNGCIFYK